MKVLFVVLACSVILAIGCAGSKSVYVDSTPDEIQNLIKKQYKKDIVAVGTGSAVDERIAIEKAVLSARVDIASQFSVKVRSLKEVFDEEINFEKVTQYKGIMDGLVEMKLEGSKIVKSMTMKNNGIYSAKVLVVLSNDVIKNELEQQLKKYTDEQSEAFKEELMKRLSE